MSYVTYKGQKYYVKDGKLKLNDKRIHDIFEIEGLEKLNNLINLNLGDNHITEIKGLEKLTNLQVLNLCLNQIVEIKGLETLTNLKELDLDYNQITEIKGLEALIKLQFLSLDSNKITEITNLDTLTNLQELNLLNNPIKNEDYYLTNKEAPEVVEYCRMQKQNKFEFDFAFSFAGEDRATVRKIRNSLVNKGISVFFDEDFEWDLIGKNLSNRFKEVYGKKSKFVVIFISEHYKIKEWTDFEFQIAREEADSRKEEFILPIRLDDTILLGIKRDVGYSDYRIKGTRKISALLNKKLEDFNKRHKIPSNISLNKDTLNNEDFWN